ncbi:MAG: hypothetical protein AAGD35_19205, partial [Actinomycetota bacterium]
NGSCWVAGVPPTTTTDPDASSVPPPPPGSFGVAGCSGGSDQQFSHGGSGELRVASTGLCLTFGSGMLPCSGGWEQRWVNEEWGNFP